MGMRLGPALAAIAMLAGNASAQGIASYDGQYMGELVLTKVVSGDCTPPPTGALYPLAVSGGQVRFSYLPRFSTILVGSVSPNGSFKASARVKTGIVLMTGRIQGSRATAQLTSPSCNYTFQTK